VSTGTTSVSTTAQIINGSVTTILNANIPVIVTVSISVLIPVTYTPTPTPASDDRALELELGLGIGIPSFLVGVAAVFYAIWRDRKKPKEKQKVQGGTDEASAHGGKVNAGDGAGTAIPSKQQHIPLTVTGSTPGIEDPKLHVGAAEMVESPGTK
jgi:hypothetical protein